MVMAKNNMTSKGKKKSGVRAVPSKKATRAVTARMLIMAFVDLFGICVLSAFKKNAVLETDFVQYCLLPATVLFGVLTAAAIVYQVIVIVKKISTSTHYVTPAMLICVAAFCFIVCLLYERLLPITIIIASVVATALFIVYCLYMHIFYR